MLPQNIIKLNSKKGWFCSEFHGSRRVPWWMEEKFIAHMRNVSMYIPARPFPS